MPRHVTAKNAAGASGKAGGPASARAPRTRGQIHHLARAKRAGRAAPATHLAGGAALAMRFDVPAIRRQLGVSQEELGRVTGYSTRAIAGWESGRTLSHSARQKLTETDRLRAALAQIMPAERVGDWLRTPNPAFEGQTPLQVMERGEADRLWRMIFQIDAGVAG